MKVEDNSDAFFAHANEAFVKAVGDTVAEARANAPRRTGEFADSIGVIGVEDDGDHVVVRIGSTIAQAGAVELGADVGPQRGPHMAGARAIGRAVESFPDHMSRRLRETAVGSGSSGGGSSSGSQARSSSSQLTPAQISSIKAEYRAGATQAQIAKRYGVSRSTVSRVAGRRRRR